MTRKELKRTGDEVIFLIAERFFGRPITAKEREDFFNLDIEGDLDDAGDPIVSTEKYGTRELQLIRRGGIYYVRLGISEGAADNGCIESSKRWCSETTEELRDFAICLGGRKWLPMVVLAVVIGPDRKAVRRIEQASLTGG